LSSGFYCRSDRFYAGPVTSMPRHRPFVCPPPITIHNDGDVRRHVFR
jgi:hypothetical protein